MNAPRTSPCPHRSGLMLVALAAAVAVGRPTSAQTADTARAGTPAAAAQIDRRVLYQNTLFRMRDGSLHAGRLSGIRGDTLLVLERGVELRVPFAQIDSVEIVGVKNDSWSTAVVGACVGAYLGTALVGSAEGQPFAYQDWEDYSYVLAAVGFAIPGACLFYLLGNASSTDHDFSFAGSPKDRLDEQKRFRDFVTGTSRARRFHARVFAGSINTRQSSVSGAAWNTFPYGMGEGSHFNLWRGLELTFSVNDWLEVGGSVTNLSEPAYSVGRWAETGGGYESYIESFEGSLFAAVGSADPLRSTLPGWFRWKVRGGIGLAGLSLNSTFYGSAVPSDPSISPVRQTILDETTVGLLVGTVLELFMFDALSVGFAVDYAVCPWAEFPAVPEFGLASKPISNTCLGFSFGIHL